MSILLTPWPVLWFLSALCGWLLSRQRTMQKQLTDLENLSNFRHDLSKLDTAGKIAYLDRLLNEAKEVQQ